MRSPIPLIDTHCHLEHACRDGSLPQLLERASAANVRGMIAVGTDPDDWAVYRELTQQHPGRIFYSVGLHPNAVDANWQQALDQLEVALQGVPAPVAIGEMGLDYFRLPADPGLAKQQREWQQQAFLRQLEIASQTHLPVIIHSRNALDDCLQLLQESGFPGKRVVFHCFSEGPDSWQRLHAYGGRASFTGIITYPSAPQVREVLKLQGTASLMLETDAPYLAPQRYRGQTNEPAYLVQTASKAAQITGTTLEQIAEQTTRNAVDFFNLTL